MSVTFVPVDKSRLLESTLFTPGRQTDVDTDVIQAGVRDRRQKEVDVTDFCYPDLTSFMM